MNKLRDYMDGVDYDYDITTQSYQPRINEPPVPDDSPSSWDIPHAMQNDFYQLEAYANNKRPQEHIKLCAFYNKLFPSLTYANIYNTATHNSLPFSIMDQEVPDTGTGMTKNYLKTVIDKVCSRLLNVSFSVKLVSSSPSLLLELYQPIIERYFSAQIEANHLEELVSECFHDAAILCYAHVFFDPWSKKIYKVNDWEIGWYEPEFEKRSLKRCLIQNREFPVSELAPYIDGMDPERLKGVINSQAHVELTLYMDCFQHKKIVRIENITGPATLYPYDSVLISTFSWDLGTKRCYGTSMFDLLFPLQRSINKFTAKQSTIYMNYKGPTPIISSNGDVDTIVHNLNNQSGEVLILSGAMSDTSKIVGEFNPTPLDENLSAETESLKATMLELSTTQDLSMNLDNLRSAAAVVALEQLRDNAFQPQMFKAARFVRNILENTVRFEAAWEDHEIDVPWNVLKDLIESQMLKIVPIHSNSLEEKPEEMPEDYQLYAVNKFIIDVVKGTKSIEDVDYALNWDILKAQACTKLLRFKALDWDISNLESFVYNLFIEDVKRGNTNLVQVPAVAVPTAGVAPGQESPAPAPEGQAA